MKALGNQFSRSLPAGILGEPALDLICVDVNDAGDGGGVIDAGDVAHTEGVLSGLLHGTDGDALRDTLRDALGDAYGDALLTASLFHSVQYFTHIRRCASFLVDGLREAVCYEAEAL